MSPAACLLGYSLVVAVLAPNVLLRATRSGSAPRMGIAAWLGAAGLVGTELVLNGGGVGEVVAGCVTALHPAAVGAHGTPVQAGLLGLAVLIVAGLAVLVLRLGRALRQARRHTHRHADAARLVGEIDEAQGTVVVDVPDRLAYAVAGRPHTIVLSRATLDALDDVQLQAVLAHERAHLAGRHHLLLTLARALATATPRIPLFTAGSSELSRLVEISADDDAARGHGRRALVGALLALSGGPTLSDGALAAATTAVADRAERLMFPPTPEQVRATRLRLGLTMTGLLSGPALGMALLLAQSGLCDGLISL